MTIVIYLLHKRLFRNPKLGFIPLIITALAFCFVLSCGSKQEAPYMTWSAVSCGAEHTLAICSSGYLWAWGNNASGQLGDSTNISKTVPTLISRQKIWQTIACGSNYSMAIRKDGSLWAWGNNVTGQLGYETTDTYVSSPVRAGTGTDWTAVACGFGHTLGLKRDGSLWSWGNNNTGQLGDSENVYGVNSTPKQVGNDLNWEAIACGVSFSVALKTDGTLWAWGDNSMGQLGDGTIIQRNTPVRLGKDSSWVKINSLYAHTAALRNNGFIWTWGNNISGQLGDGTTIARNNPTRIGTDIDWLSTACGGFYTVALKNDGSLWAWGDNKDGQLGDTAIKNKGIPNRIGADSDWKTIACGYRHTMALKNNGTLWAWGSNAKGQLGDGTLVNKSSPLLIGK